MALSSLLRRKLPQLLRSNVLRVYKGNVLAGVATRTITSFLKKNRKSTAISTQTKSEYEIELQRLIEKDQYREKFGFYEDEPYLDKFMFHMIMFLGYSLSIVFSVIILTYGPDFRSRMVDWKEYEALELIKERTAKGLPLVNPDFAPAELMESMVPPPGDWEKEWLSNQPTTKPALKYWKGSDMVY